MRNMAAAADWKKTRNKEASDLELVVLLWLASGNPGDSSDLDKGVVVERLVSYDFRDPKHKILFDTLRRIAHRDATTIRDHLPAALVRAGFPDVDFQFLFYQNRVTDDAAMTALRLLAENADFRK